jgi:hypothetical protein
MSHTIASPLQILHPYFLQIYLLHPYLNTTLKYVTLPSSPIPLHATHHPQFPTQVNFAAPFLPHPDNSQSRHPLFPTHVHLLLALNPTLHFPHLKCTSNLYPLFILPYYLIIHPYLLHLLPTRATTPLLHPLLLLDFVP